MKGYENHRSDPEYVSRFHESVNGLISEYRKGVQDMLKALTGKLLEGSMPTNQSLIKQAKWASVDLLKLQGGLAKYNTYSVEMLNEEYMMEHIDGVVDRELAYFLINIARCKSFKLSSRPKKSSVVGLIDGYDIIVQFDDEAQAHMFGCAANLNEM